MYCAVRPTWSSWLSARCSSSWWAHRAIRDLRAAFPRLAERSECTAQFVLPGHPGCRPDARPHGGLIVLFAIFVPHFLVLPNVLNVLRSSSYLVILAVGQMLVLMVGGFDLSVGAVVTLTSVSSALVMAGLKGQMADQP